MCSPGRPDRAAGASFRRRLVSNIKNDYVYQIDLACRTLFLAQSRRLRSSSLKIDLHRLSPITDGKQFSVSD
jgi:hypothetical protein